MKLASWLFVVSLAMAPPALRADGGQAEIVAMLTRQDYGALEELLAARQHRFEDGTSTEYELQEAFEPFETLRDPQVPERLREWVAQSPQSYVAHLALGLNDRAAGSAARGRMFWDRTTPEQRDGLVQHFTRAEPELRKSITLSSKPYLSLLNLMTIAGNVGNRPYLNATLLLADEALPSNQLARLNYARYLLPRWGGSDAKFDAFVATSRQQGVAEGTLLKLQALGLNDRGMVALAAHRDAEADALFAQALQLGRRSGDEGRFRATWLAASVKRMCRGPSEAEACGPAEPGTVVAASATGSSSTGPWGNDIEHAIVIPTDDDLEGIRTEYAWLALRYPGAKRTTQALIPRADRRYDMLAVKTADGRELQLYFDITAFLSPPEPRPATFVE